MVAAARPRKMRAPAASRMRRAARIPRTVRPSVTMAHDSSRRREPVSVQPSTKKPPAAARKVTVPIQRSQLLGPNFGCPSDRSASMIGLLAENPVEIGRERRPLLLVRERASEAVLAGPARFGENLALLDAGFPAV